MIRIMDMIDLGAVSTRPGAEDVSVEEEWRRLEPTLKSLADRAVVEQYGLAGVEFSIDTTSSEIVRRAFDTFGRFIVNDISAGEDDPEMLGTVASLGLLMLPCTREAIRVLWIPSANIPQAS